MIRGFLSFEETKYWTWIMLFELLCNPRDEWPSTNPYVIALRFATLVFLTLYLNWSHLYENTHPQRALICSCVLIVTIICIIVCLPNSIKWENKGRSKREMIRSRRTQTAKVMKNRCYVLSAIPIAKCPGSNRTQLVGGPMYAVEHPSTQVSNAFDLRPG